MNREVRDIYPFLIAYVPKNVLGFSTLDIMTSAVSYPLQADSPLRHMTTPVANVPVLKPYTKLGQARNREASTPSLTHC